ncbi:MAG: hypothetical protein ABWY16_01960 [Pedobacter sp.]|uniref:hypothetical protein n=1 Tax=Pedobacter sp. TaxID=1411316 RepID=UPI003392F962
MVKINEYIESGVLEAYVLGSASEAETRELLYLKAKHPQVSEALRALETDLEHIAQKMAITPPPGTWTKIEANINEIIKARESDALTIDMPYRDQPRESSRSRKSSQFVEVEAESGHMRIRKIWRWIFAGVFLLGKIFLACAIYFYIENRHNEKEIEILKTELRNSRGQ